MRIVAARWGLVGEKVVVTGCRAKIIPGGLRYCVRGTSGMKHRVGEWQFQWQMSKYYYSRWIARDWKDIPRRGQG